MVNKRKLSPGDSSVNETSPNKITRRHSTDVSVPEYVDRGPSPISVAGSDKNYKWYQEPLQFIPDSIWNDIRKTVMDLNIQQPKDALETLRNNWNVLHSYINVREPHLHHYNYRMIGKQRKDPRDYFKWIYLRYSTKFRVKSATHCLLFNKRTSEYKFFYASNNNYLLQVPNKETDHSYYLIKDQKTRDEYLQAISPLNIQNQADKAADSSEWVTVFIVGIHCWVLPLTDRIIGKPSNSLPILKNNPHIRGFRFDKTRNYYTDNLCVFRLVEDCLSNGDGFPSRDSVLKRFDAYSKLLGWKVDNRKFMGLGLDDLYMVERFFGLRFNVYHISEDKRIHIIRMAVEETNTPLFYADLQYENDCYHFSRIMDVDKIVGQYYCRFCDKKINSEKNLRRHMMNNSCERGQTKFDFPGGVFAETPSIFEQLIEVGIKIHIPPDERFYRFRCCFDFESILEKMNGPILRPPLQTESEAAMRLSLENLDFEIIENETATKLQYIAKHRPCAFSIATNVPGYDTAPFVIDEKSPNDLVDVFLNYLEEMSAVAYRLENERFSSEIEQLNALERQSWDDVKKEADVWEKEHDTKLKGTPAKIWHNKLSQLNNRFLMWRQQFVVVGFNSGRYDISLIKEYLYPKLVENIRLKGVKLYDERVLRMLGLFKASKLVKDVADTENKPLPYHQLPKLIKQGNSILCLSTPTLRFLDFTRYLTAGTSLDKFLKAWAKQDAVRLEKGLPPCPYGLITQTKIPFPYTFLDSFEKLEYIGVPPRSAFKDSLKNKEISDDEYAFVVDLYKREGFKNLRDYLHFYVCLDVVPFLMAVNKSFAQYFHITGIDIFKEAMSLPSITLKYLGKNTQNFNFSLFKKADEHIHKSMREGMTGGLAQINNRFARVGETMIRGNPNYIVKNIFGLDFNSLYLSSLAEEMPVGWFDYWKKFVGYKGPFLSRQRTNQSVECQWLEYIRISTNVEIIHAGRQGYQKRVGPRAFPVDGLDVKNKIVYEMMGCYFHVHNVKDCGLNKCNYNKQLNRSTAECWAEIQFRKQYYESLGYRYVYIWECHWKAMRIKPHIAQIIVGLNTKHFSSVSTVHETKMIEGIRQNNVFGFAKVSLHTPTALRGFFEDYLPIIKHAVISREDIGEKMKGWCEENDELKRPRKALIGSYWGKEVWLMTPVIRYLMEKGLILDEVHEVLQYDRQSVFGWFKDIVTEKRSAADAAPEMSLLGDTFKLFGNTAFGRSLTALERHRIIALITELYMGHILNDPFLDDVEVVGGAYQISMRPRRKQMNLPIQIGIAVFNYSKLYMLKFAYDLLGKYCDKAKYDWLLTDTDSIYLMSSEKGVGIENVDFLVRPELKAEYDEIKHKFLVLGPKDKRTPGLLKVEYDGGKTAVCLCPKTYIISSNDDEEADKISSKGLMKRTNKFSVENYKEVLEQEVAGSGINIGFVTKQNEIRTYVQERTGLSYLYIKRKVMSDGVSTQPLDL